jgi:hypothetical protein
MLMRFIGSAPAGRYEELEPFFNVDDFVAYERQLQGLSSSYSQRVNDEDVALIKQGQRLRLLLAIKPEQPISEIVIQEVLKTTLQSCGFPEDTSPAALAERKADIEKEMTGFAADARLTQLSALKKAFTDLVPISTYENMLAQLRETQLALLKAEADRAEVVPADFLRAGRDLIEKSPESGCPLCESIINGEAVLERLAARIASDENYAAAVETFDQARRGALKALSLYLRDFKGAITAWEKAFDGEELPPPYATEVETLTALVAGLETKQPLGNLDDLIAATKTGIVSHAPRFGRIDTAIAEGGGERRAALGSLLALIQIRDTEFAAYAKRTASLKQLKRHLRLAERVAAHATQARKQTVQQIVDDLAKLANEYYEFIHPGEGIAKAALEIRQVGTGSVDIRTEFSGKSEHPMLHFSESHLDTLGLCFFLAARRMECSSLPNFRLLVLDDVIHSVDAEHRERVARLLAEKFSDHQIVVVTHDTIFYQRLRHYLGSQFEYVYFSSWTMEAGPVRTTSSTDVDRVTIKEVRDTLTADELAAASGRFFEFLLRIVTERLNIAIPARFSRPHDIGNMWPPLYSKLRNAANASPTLKAVVGRIDENQWIRNQIGAHFNEPSVPVTDKEVRGLAEALADFYSLTFCPVCRTTVEKRSGNDWRCGCEALKYQVPAQPVPAD